MTWIEDTGLNNKQNSQGKKHLNFVWLLVFEPRSPRQQRGILNTKLQPQHITSIVNEGIYEIGMFARLGANAKRS